MFLVTIGTLIPTAIMAQQEVPINSMSFALSYVSSDADISAGDIVSLREDQTVTRSSEEFDPNVLGVFTPDATMIYHSGNDGIAIVVNGVVDVNVTTRGGTIETGTFITTSTIPGKGQATDAPRGHIIGTSLTSFGENDGTVFQLEDGTRFRQGTVQVKLNIRPGDIQSVGIASKVVDQIGSVFLKNISTPERSEAFFRYIMAGLVSVIAIGVGFISFGRNITTGIEAMGRNPLARAQIQAMILLNVGLIAIISIAGIVLSMAIIRF
ncbi:hypothetical protein A3B56_01100 [Candidatus Roizmanbacteria bacterium RIFCSPLOWO2_01_FULL_45_11]|uniref:Uncharacterized protein n=1 Tax=Candidatus Roizmanbacteria bacterium RIFCSPLOWO2_01_FULL_45_11 TaxID=1802070 RepID=A0A1F7JGS9_9BACT|nr:MAG: hypothetical protein A3B56_01100 [Candidatus Roizmanbacteria bacterium RIFCSPLOWO2_01_FULL_45_11]